jgi:hypothetical protein
VAVASGQRPPPGAGDDERTPGQEVDLPFVAWAKPGTYNLTLIVMSDCWVGADESVPVSAGCAARGGAARAAWPAAPRVCGTPGCHHTHALADTAACTHPCAQVKLRINPLSAARAAALAEAAARGAGAASDRRARVRADSGASCAVCALCGGRRGREGGWPRCAVPCGRRLCAAHGGGGGERP